MAATDVTAPAATGPAPPPRRRLASRVSSGHLLTIAAALLAAVLNFAVLRGGDGTTAIAVAASDIPVGASLDPSVVRSVSADLDGDTLASLLPADELASLGGQVALVPIPAGAPIRRADLADPAATGDGRLISVPVDRDRAVGGAIRPEDRIDVIRVVEGESSYLVSNARVLSVSDGTTPGLGALGGFHVTIAVDAATALCLASAIEAGGLSIVVSTGQEPVATTPCAAATAEAGGEVAAP